MRVVDIEGRFVGFVKELQNQDSIVRRPAQEDLRVPAGAYRMSSDHVALTLPQGRVDRTSWENRYRRGEPKWP